jgi:hypothetical protein
VHAFAPTTVFVVSINVVAIEPYLRFAPASTSRPSQLIAGFEVSINCRFWVSTDGTT